jgi:cellulose synthase/poly-beta-1,6-N-acetylglucosamine synthase-like glycosyltransferase
VTAGPLADVPFASLPLPFAVLFWIALVLVTGALMWTAALSIAARRHDRAGPIGDPAHVDEFLWVFLVPALNEEVTIADSVHRLLQVEAANKVILVINDGSDDSTGHILAGLATTHPELSVVTRTQPDARQGKSEALNCAWNRLDTVLADPRWSGLPRRKVIVVVVDADGRLDPGAPRVLASRFATERMGGVQCRVRIYNRRHLLTWLQDVEFGVYGGLYQAGRGWWGIAGMGGNGQANRLTALDDLRTDIDTGPWRNRLTEDQDLGLRLLRAGWECDHDNTAAVHQQGLSSLRRLYRQRTRWAQGNLQALTHLRNVRRMPIGVRRVEVTAYLLNPILQAFVGLTFVLSVLLYVLGIASIIGDRTYLELVPILVLGLGGLWLGCLARNRGRGLIGILLATATVPAYAVYSWMIWPVLLRAALRQFIGRGSWAKTAREPLAPTRPRTES